MPTGEASLSHFSLSLPSPLFGLVDSQATSLLSSSLFLLSSLSSPLLSFPLSLRGPIFPPLYSGGDKFHRRSAVTHCVRSGCIHRGTTTTCPRESLSHPVLIRLGSQRPLLLTVCQQDGKGRKTGRWPEEEIGTRMTR